MRKIWYRLSVFFLFFICLHGPIVSSAMEQIIPTGKSNVQFAVVKEKPDDSQAKLYSVVSGKRHLLDTIYVTRSLSCMDGCMAGQIELVDSFKPILAPDGKTVVYSDLTACGYEGDGSALYVTDLEGKTRRPLVGSCNFVEPQFFFEHKKRVFLVLWETNGGYGISSSWIWDMNDFQPVIHVGGIITKLADGQLEFCSIVEGECGSKKKIDTDLLLKRALPLPLLPRYPVTATVVGNARWQINDSPMMGCWGKDEKGGEPLSPGTLVLVLMKCEKEGRVEIFHDKKHGTIDAKYLHGVGI